METSATGIHFCVIADDLTGAMDTGVGLAKAGLHTTITFSSIADLKPEAVVATTDSRAISPTEAYKQVRTVGERFRDYYIYKKIDSTLRGNIAAELQALLDLTQASKAVVCPAFPSIKRTVVNGELLVEGVPVHQTALSKDPVSPVTKSDIADLLQSGSGISSESISLADVELGPQHLAQRIADTSSKAVVVDATEDKHLRCIADALALNRESWLPCGSGGLGAQLPVAFGLTSHGQSLPPTPPGYALMAIGSRNEVSVRQIHRLIEKLNPPVIGVEPRQFGTRTGRRPRANQIAHDARRKLVDKQLAILSSSLSDFVPQYRYLMAHILGDIVIKILEGGDVTGLFLCGGDVARAVCGEERIQALHILGELQPGVVVGEAVGQHYEGLRIVTKAGGFGNEDALVQVARYFSERGH
ncbi:MAG: four-carbon acid sugar kinase family protein [Dehalococcoidia bacterium]|nr:four-carbon acid sugar kinase family protein [Dehalococcoidia bacterium]